VDTTALGKIFRAEISDVELPNFVSDDLMYSYIDDAQKMFFRLTEGIEDGRSFKLSILPDVEWYDLDKSILKLRKATNTLDGTTVDVVNIEKSADQGIRFDNKKGPIKALVAGIERQALRAWPMPNQAATVQLDTFRLPHTVSNGDEFEIDEQHQRHLLMWVKYLTYNIEDSELFNKRKADEYEGSFRAYCAMAKREQERARRVVGTVSYGGI
jgi:hypothetical protein